MERFSSRSNPRRLAMSKRKSVSACASRRAMCRRASASRLVRRAISTAGDDLAVEDLAVEDLALEDLAAEDVAVEDLTTAARGLSSRVRRVDTPVLPSPRRVTFAIRIPGA